MRHRAAPVLIAGGGAVFDEAVLVRPDSHVAWRGDAALRDPDGLIALVRGAA